MELYLSVWFDKDGSFRVYNTIAEDQNVRNRIFIVRETPWPRKGGNLLW